MKFLKSKGKWISSFFWKSGKRSRAHGDFWKAGKLQENLGGIGGWRDLVWLGSNNRDDGGYLAMLVRLTAGCPFLITPSSSLGFRNIETMAAIPTPCLIWGQCLNKLRRRHQFAAIVGMAKIKSQLISRLSAVVKQCQSTKLIKKLE